MIVYVINIEFIGKNVFFLSYRELKPMNFMSQSFSQLVIKRILKRKIELLTVNLILLAYENSKQYIINI